MKRFLIVLGILLLLVIGGLVYLQSQLHSAESDLELQQAQQARMADGAMSEAEMVKILEEMAADNPPPEEAAGAAAGAQSIPAEEKWPIPEPAFWADEYDGDYETELIEEEGKTITLLLREDGSTAEKTILTDEGEIIEEAYDQKGGLRERLIFLEDGIETRIFDGQGVLLECNLESPERTERICYNADGSLLYSEINASLDSGEFSVEIIFYQKDNKPHKRTLQLSEEFLEEYYDEEGKLRESYLTTLEESIETVYNEDGSYTKRIVSFEEDSLWEETYDAQGKLQTQRKVE